jgi:hypothetical protein
MRSIIATLSASGLLMAVPVAAQTARDANSTREAYGARLAPESSETDFSTVRVNKRLDTRIASRISTRIERYRVGATADPAAAFSAARDQLIKQVTPVQPAP